MAGLFDDIEVVDSPVKSTSGLFDDIEVVAPTNNKSSNDLFSDIEVTGAPTAGSNLNEIDSAPPTGEPTFMDSLGAEGFVDTPFEPYEVEPNISLKTIADESLRSPMEIGTNIVGGAMAWVPSMVAKFGQVGHQTILNQVAKDVISNPDQYDQKAVEGAKKALQSPTDIQAFGRESEELLASYFGAMPDVTTESGKRIMNVVGEALHNFTKPARLAASYIPDEYPNAKDFVQTIGELGLFMVAGTGGKKIARKVKSFNKKIKNKDYKGANDTATDLLDTAVKKHPELADTLITPENLAQLEIITAPKTFRSPEGLVTPEALANISKLKEPKVYDLSNPTARQIFIDTVWGEPLSLKDQASVKALREREPFFQTNQEKIRQSPEGTVKTPEMMAAEMEAARIAEIQAEPTIPTAMDKVNLEAQNANLQRQNLMEGIKPEPTIPGAAQNIIDAALPAKQRRAGERAMEVRSEEMRKLPQQQKIDTLVDANIGKSNIPAEAAPIVEAATKARFNRLLKTITNQKGEVNIDFSRKGRKAFTKFYGKSPKGLSLLNRLKREGLSNDVLDMSGIKTYLINKGQNPINVKDLQKIMKESSIDLEKIDMNKTNAKKKVSLYNELNELEGARISITQQIKDATNLQDRNHLQKQLEFTDQRTNQINWELNHQDTSYGPEKNPKLNLPNDKGNYNEVYYRYTPKEGSFKESHFKEGENVLAHRRTHDRALTDGTIVKHIDELQSVWHDKLSNNKVLSSMQKSKIKKRLQEATAEIDFLEKSTMSILHDTNLMPFKKEPKLRNIDRQISKIRERIDEYVIKLKNNNIPNAPYKNSWYKMVMRDAIKEAIAEGKDGVTWSTSKILSVRAKGLKSFQQLYDSAIPKFLKSEYGIISTKKSTVIRPADEAMLDLLKRHKETLAKLKNKDSDAYHSSTRIIAKLEKDSRVKDTITSVHHIPLTDKLKAQFDTGTLEAPLRPKHSIMDMLKDQRGELSVEKLTSAERARLNTIGKEAARKGLNLREYLKSEGYTKENAKKIEKIYTEMKQAEAIRTTDPIESSKTEERVNTTSDANKMVDVGRSVMEDLKSAKNDIVPGWVESFTPAIHTMIHSNSKTLRGLYHSYKTRNKAKNQEAKVIKQEIKALTKEFNDRKLRREAGEVGLAKTLNGKEAMERMGIIPKVGKIAYQKLLDVFEPKFQKLFERINEIRISIGEKPIKPMVDEYGRNVYMPFFAQESFLSSLRDVIKGTKAERANIMTDSAADIAHRNSNAALNATPFHHLKRGTLRTGKKLETDPLKLYAKYTEEALNHIHMSPLTAFVKEIVKKPLVDSVTGERYKLEHKNPRLAEFLNEWSKSIAGIPNAELPRKFRFLEKAATKITKNLTAATLYYSARTAMVQLTALLPTMTEFGAMKTADGVRRMMFRSKKDPIHLSTELDSRVFDAFLLNSANEFGGNLYQRAKIKGREYGIAGMKALDYVAAEATWRTAYKEAITKGKYGKVTKEQAARLADEAVVRTQGSGARGDLSPIQMSAIGKAMTLWQTFTINHINFLAKDVLGIKNPTLNQAETIKRVGRYIIGSAAISTLFEDGMGIQSPQPAPIKALINGIKDDDPAATIMLNTILEAIEIVPVGSTLKFGSDPLGPAAGLIGEVWNVVAGSKPLYKDLIQKALDGDTRSRIKLMELLGKATGVGGTGQSTKYVRGRLRGESHIGSVLGTYDEDKATSGSGRKSRKGRKSRSTRSSR